METKPGRMMFCYPGSKSKLASQFVKLFPPHTIYVSPFAGTACEFAHKEPSNKEIVNDIDDNIYSVFAALRDRRLFGELFYRLKNSLDSRRLYEESNDRLRFDKHLPLLDRAYCFLIVGNFGFQGVHPLNTRSYACGVTKRPRKLDSLLKAILVWRNRMRSVICEHLDVFDIFDKYDSPKTFFYLDPPYHSATRTHNLYAHDNLDQREFLKRIQNIKGKAFVCGYEHGLYDVQLQGWRKVVFPTEKSMGGRNPRNEVVWMNYDERGQKIKQDFDLIKAFENLQA